jgi:hypothetical protein
MDSVLQNGGFEVLIDGYTGSSWREFGDAPTSGPDLTGEQKDFARKFGLDEEVYKQHYWSLLRDTEELRKRIRRFGGLVGEVLKSVGPGLQLRAIYFRATEDHCTLKIETPGGAVQLNVSRDYIEDYRDTGANRDSLKRLVISGLSGKVA